MRYRSDSLALAVSFRPWLRKGALLCLLLAGFALVYAEKTQRDWVSQLRLGLLSVTAPVADILASPVRAVEDLATSWSHLWQVYADNKQLRYENEQLLAWRDTALKLEAENAALRKLMAYQPKDDAHFIAAKRIGNRGSGLAQRITIDAGLADGVRRHMPVINGHGLIGRTLSVSGAFSQVLLLTDVNSRIPVVLRPSGARALLIGDNSQLPYLKLENPKQELALGEVVMTSDDGDLLPAGLRIGTLFAQAGGQFEVRPDFTQKPLDMLRVLTRK